MNHSKCCYFNALLYLTSPLLTAIEFTIALRTVRTLTAGLSFILVLELNDWAFGEQGGPASGSAVRIYLSYVHFAVDG